MAKKAIEKLLNKAYFYLYLRSRSEHEMRQYLLKKAVVLGADSQDVEVVIQELKTHKYLNDDEFIQSFVRYRSSFKPKGEYALRQELKQKGISEEKISKFFEDANLDELLLAKEALLKAWNRYKNLDPLKRKRRILDFLGRRGFSYNTSQEALDMVEKNN